MRPPELTRRGFLAAGLGAAGLVLAGCGGGSGSGTDRLRAAVAAGGSRESLDPHVLPLYVDQARAKACFDTLTGWSQDMTPEPRLAESWESDPSGTRWRIVLRDARFHDDRPLTADDVLYLLRRITDPATTGIAAALFRDLDLTASRATAPRELELVLNRPNFVFPLAWGAPGTEIVQQGATTFDAPVGTGPFRFASFTPGGPALYTAFDGHWDGRPAIGELEFLPVDDEEARIGALLSGQIDYAHDLTPAGAARLDGDARASALSAPASANQFLVLRVDRPPFDDPRLREAVRLGIDREELVRIALLGRGRPGNDMFGQGLRYYPDVPQVTRDVDRARALVADAGAQGLAVELQTSGADPNFDAATAVVARQLDGIGLRVTPRALPSENYFKAIRQQGVFSQNSTGALPIPDYVGRRMLTSTPTYDFTGYRNPEIDRLYYGAIGTDDEAARTDGFGRIMQTLRADSGGLVWGVRNWNVGVSGGVAGLEPARPNTFAWANFAGARLA
ncbi:ABC transporter component, periplasmic oligopeptide binding protein [Pseudonocardia sp. Ae168_Ps1]|uniref:ABC transporter substrate-binding protein n=1 Tax=unclassified Pseudonocardia TaxID=2619320 RepID=UPI00094AB850|nr:MULTISPECIES: ABC transporter substrate-binding protein [unclassified Pseudonocardia]OLL74443.1 ABC transporter component, periplasmic oligopeptide binding protein [Pseudonocardia sp. Ae150A_Ps1]OLL80423.1 ABC transporter component, periplasmic oligopeptide binding protein [Pseudonocardia sp. Ae168_Ps1]OLL85450.1 ABC transporter component, periplasmic oligopeptide binding protein [Pseudonocardia sp. Ae263_Ps1]OLL94523.1 ABC transporter component, periplasmic oligopeptide binding protein [Pse